jgi:acetolactate synthase-1/2/3 large subunit
VDLGIVSDVRALAAECLRIVGRRGSGEALTRKFSPWIAHLRQGEAQSKEFANLTWKSGNTPIHPMRLMREIDDFMDREDDIVAADGGDTTTWMGMTRTIRRPGHYLDYGLYGSLGVGLPYANAAKLLYPEKRVLLINGDGSLGFNFMEFETALRKGLNIVVVVSNDLGWGMIRHSQEIRLGKAIETGTWIGRVDYHRMVEGLGGKGFLVERPEDIRPALEQAFACKVPACVNVMTDPTTVSPGSQALAGIGGYKA